MGGAPLFLRLQSLVLPMDEIPFVSQPHRQLHLFFRKPTTTPSQPPVITPKLTVFVIENSDKAGWCSGYHVCLTHKRCQVRSLGRSFFGLDFAFVIAIDCFLFLESVGSAHHIIDV